MADTRTFPKIPATAWWRLRRRFHQSVPKQVTANYLQTVLDVQAGHANNLVPQLEAVGLIDESGTPTALANQWRTDDGYPKACKAIIDAVYPSGLTDAVPPTNPDADAAARWFMNELQVGNDAARQMARFYALVAKGDPSDGDATQATTGGPAPGHKEPKQKPAKAKLVAAPKPSESVKQGPPTPEAPDLRIAVQVHIPSDASPDQIDAIFASMAKHLYRR
jgi:hypothetical protein